MKHLVFFQLIILVFPLIMSAQRDSTKKEMTFDFGLTRDKNINIWPVFKYQKNEQGKELQLLSPIYKHQQDYINKSKHTHLFPLFWNDSSKVDQDIRLLSLYYPSLFHYSIKDTGSISSFKFLELAPEISMMEFTKSKDGLYIQNNLLFFLWFKNDIIRKRSYFVFFPAYWSFKSPERQSNTFFPLYSYGKFNNKKSNYLAITPLFWQIKHPKRKTNLLLPLWYSRTQGIGDEQKRISFVSPLFYSYRSKTERNTVLFPLIWSFRNPVHSSFTFVPFFSKGSLSNQKSKHLMITPFYWNFVNENEKTNLLFPLWYNRLNHTVDSIEYTNIIFPFYWMYRDKFKTNKVLAPFLWSFENQRYTSFTFFPLFSRGHTSDNSQGYMAITPLYWQFYRPENYTRFLFPLLYNKKTGSGENETKFNVLFPFLWERTTPTHTKKVIFPIVWASKTPKYKSFTFFPVISTGKSTDSLTKHLAITPLFWQLKRPESKFSTLFPLWFSKTKTDSSHTKTSRVLFPLYWAFRDSMKNNKVLFPLIWSIKNPYYKTFSFLPLYSHRKSTSGHFEHYAVSPLYWHFKRGEQRTNLLLPIWFNQKSKDTANVFTKNVIFPIYWSHTDSIKHNKVLFPLVWSYNNPKFKSFSVFPLYSNKKSHDGRYKHTSITPLFWHIKHDNKRTNILLPVWYNQKKGIGDSLTSRNVVFPLYWSHKTPETNSKLLLPLIHYHKTPEFKQFSFIPFYSRGKWYNTQKKYLMVTPLYWHSSDRNKTTNLLLPVYFNQTKYHGLEKSRFDVVFPVYWSYHDKNINNKFLLPFVWKMQDAKYASFTVLPFYSQGESKVKDFKHRAVTPLFLHFERNDRKTNLLLPVWYNRTRFTKDDTIRTNISFPLYWSFKNKRKNNKVLFPVVWSLRNPNYNSFTFFPLISAGKSNTGAYHHLFFTPLLWNLKRPDYKSIGLFPVFKYRKSNNGDTKFNTGIVLFRYRKKEGLKTADFLWPFCQYESGMNNKYFRFAPLIWYKNTPEQKLFSFQPLYYKRETKKFKSHHILWQLFVYKNYFNEKKSLNFLWRALFWDKYTNSDFELRFFHLLLANVKRDGNIEKSVFPFYYYNQQTNGEKSRSLFFHFYNSFKRKLPGIDEFYREERIFWFIRLRSNYKKLVEEGKMKPKK